MCNYVTHTIIKIPDKAKKSLYRFSMTCNDLHYLILYINHSIVFSVCQARGQNPRIAMEMEKIFMENNNVKIIQSECRSCNTSKST